ncbi:MAG: FAD-dependent oxidoreductase [Eubacterium sp.]|nr:FAD-dependent oxidoreductase [Eubacterium sp.]
MEYINITIDGIEIEARKGQTILEIATQNGIDIPTLCNDERVKPYGACGLCVVEVEGSPKLMRACASTANDGMKIHTHTERVEKSRKVAMELIMSDHSGDCRGPCTLNCPAGTDCQSYVKQIALGNYTEAVKIIRDRVPLPSCVGRICPHPCEDACRRNLVDEPVSICSLKAFASDMDYNTEDSFVPEVAPSTGKKVCIIGGGVSGMTAGYYLRIKGHDITILDAMPKNGGMFRYGIPNYRLPKNILEQEINVLRRMGITFRNNVFVGKDVQLEDLRKEYDAVVVAIGAWNDTPLRCEGEDLEGVLGGIKFLSDIGLGVKHDLGKNIAVVGGGNTAMDACRSAMRHGAEHVYVIYRRTQAEMPAEEIEIEEAMEEGVEFKFLTNPAEIIGENGHVKAIKLQVMELGEPDASGRRRPVPVEGKFETLEVDTVIAAIGHVLRPDGFEALEKSPKGNIEAGIASFRTSMDGVFAIGEATNKGASIAIEAIGEANRAVEQIHNYLYNKTTCFKEPFYSEKKVSEEDLADRPKMPRHEMPRRDRKLTKLDFQEVNLGLSEEDAREEAKRCLECGCHDYESCTLIRRARELDINPKRFEGSNHPSYKEERLEIIERDQGKCLLCGLCVRICDEQAKQGILGLVGRGFGTVVKPEFRDPATIAVCKDCGLCVSACPTGALKLLDK